MFNFSLFRIQWSMSYLGTDSLVVFFEKIIIIQAVLWQDLELFSITLLFFLLKYDPSTSNQFHLRLVKGGRGGGTGGLCQLIQHFILVEASLIFNFKYIMTKHTTLSHIAASIIFPVSWLRAVCFYWWLQHHLVIINRALFLVTSLWSVIWHVPITERQIYQ